MCFEYGRFGHSKEGCKNNMKEPSTIEIMPGEPEKPLLVKATSATLDPCLLSLDAGLTSCSGKKAPLVIKSKALDFSSPLSSRFDAIDNDNDSATLEILLDCDLDQLEITLNPIHPSVDSKKRKAPKQKIPKDRKISSYTITYLPNPDSNKLTQLLNLPIIRNPF